MAKKTTTKAATQAPAQSATNHTSAAAAFRQLVLEDNKERKVDPYRQAQDAGELDKNFRYIYVPDLMHQWALGRPGYVLGRVKLTVGGEGASKSSSLYYDCNLCLKQGGLAAIVALEEADSTEHIKAYVENYKDVMLFPARTLEDGIRESYRIQRLFKEIDPDNKLPKVQGFDSIAGATEDDQLLENDDEDEDDPDPSKQRPGGIGKVMKQFMNAMKTSIVETNTLWVVLNQAREHIYTGFGAEYQMKKPLRERLALTGGKAQRFVATYFEFIERINAAKEKEIVDDEEIKTSVGFNVSVDWIKNKTFRPDRKITRQIRFGQSFDYSPFTIPALAASSVCGLSVDKKRYWCDAIGIPRDSRMTAREIYPIVHSPEHIGMFQKELGLLGLEDVPIIGEPPSSPVNRAPVTAEGPLPPGPDLPTN